MVNWPPNPSLYPDWPPRPWINADRFYCSGLKALIMELSLRGFTLDQPTNQERQTFFQPAACGQGHNVRGRMLVSPNGLQRWPFGVCTNATHQELLTLWEPYSAGPRSGLE